MKQVLANLLQMGIKLVRTFIIFIVFLYFKLEWNPMLTTPLHIHCSNISILKFGKYMRESAIIDIAFLLNYYNMPNSLHVGISGTNALSKNIIYFSPNEDTDQSSWAFILTLVIGPVVWCDVAWFYITK